MVFNKKATTKNQIKLIEAIYEITQSDESEIKFGGITWDAEKPILKLKGRNETPDFTITFGIDEKDPDRVHIVTDCDSSHYLYFQTTYYDIEEFNSTILVKPILMMLVKDILTACSQIMLRLGIHCHMAYYDGEYGLLKLTPADEIQFLSTKAPFYIGLETITEASLLDCVEVPDITDAILIKTDSGKSYFIALDQADEFASKLEERINKLRNVELQMAS